ncbi:AhpC/TSA family [Rubrobacter radiotolerans]|uniref:AhpC/TSA family n=1 Tax=Rubrobacter radiotolerans TaxID=42256 RepID=A0A023X638_RUBRA|nr:hypothetical protein [Rubrobacter radiotolerans]AHY47813.1 AhpC/TSA family [Rubrobacter radiotolerans]MDX5892452.1 hypothetical protein [Rubrobacter radiotolerans]SMC07743.1 hypothetical protein SAMN00767673_2603 [Rubrobacter radiotolerans DSM 5868]
MALSPGTLAPFFSTIASGSGRRVSLRSCAGRPLVLVFHGRENAEVVQRVNRALRERYPRAEELTVASVIDLSFVPPLYWGVASMELDRAFRQAAAELPDGVDPKDYVVILPDWTGSTTRKYRARGARHEAVSVVVDADSTVLGTVEGDDPAEPILAALEGRSGGR